MKKRMRKHYLIPNIYVRNVVSFISKKKLEDQYYVKGFAGEFLTIKEFFQTNLSSLDTMERNS